MSRIASIIERIERGEVIDPRRELMLFALDFAAADERHIAEWKERERIADEQFAGNSSPFIGARIG